METKMNCVICGNKLVQKTKKIKLYCGRKCANEVTNKRKIQLSIKLTAEQVKIILDLQEKFLEENKQLEEIK